MIVFRIDHWIALLYRFTTSLPHLLSIFLKYLETVITILPVVNYPKWAVIFSRWHGLTRNQLRRHFLLRIPSTSSIISMSRANGWKGLVLWSLKETSMKFLWQNFDLQELYMKVQGRPSFQRRWEWNYHSTKAIKKLGPK